MAYEVVRSGAPRSASRRETYVEEEEVVIRRAVRRRPLEDVEPRRATRRLDDDGATRSRRRRDDDEYITIRRPRSAANEPIRVKVEEDPPKKPGFIAKVGKGSGSLLAAGVAVGGFAGVCYGGLQAFSGSHAIPGVGSLATSGAPGLLIAAGFVALVAGAAVWHRLNPKA